MNYADRKLELMEQMGTRRLTEATAQARSAAGAVASYYDPIDRDSGYRRLGSGPRDMPERTRELARMDSIVAGRANPMGRAIIDTYTAFCVGDSGLSLQCSSDIVRPVVERFWHDPRNRFQFGHERMFRTWLVMGEQLQEMMVGGLSGRVRRSPIDPSRICGVTLRDGNPLWHESVQLGVPGADPISMEVIDWDDTFELRMGQVMYWPAFQVLESDTRGVPFLTPILDWLDSYDNVLSNLVDRTALSRYLVWDVTIDGDDEAVKAFVAARGGTQAPRSGSVEVHNNKVAWEPKTAQTGAFEDLEVEGTIMTQLAAGTGLSKPWLAEPEDANRATALTMAEPVRRRIGGVQNEWLANLTEMARFAVDMAVLAGRIPADVPITAPGGEVQMIPASETVRITGPAVAAADAQVMAEVLVNLAQAVTTLHASGLYPTEAAQEALRKAHEDYVGIPFRHEFGKPDAEVDALAQHIDEQGGSMPLLAA